MYAKARMVASFFTSLLVCLIIVDVARGFAASREVGGANFSDIKAIRSSLLFLVLWCHFYSYMYGYQFDHTSQKYL
jgi:hypothetical protein